MDLQQYVGLHFDFPRLLREIVNNVKESNPGKYRLVVAHRMGDVIEVECYPTLEGEIEHMRFVMEGKL